MTTIEKQERELERKERTLHHVAALIAGLGGDPTQYEYKGVWSDAGPHSGAKCACGQEIRYCFDIVHKVTGEHRTVGSVCVNHFQVCAPELYAQMETAVGDMKTALAAELAKAKAAQAQAEVEALEAQYTEAWKALRAQYETLRKEHGRYFRIPRPLWEAFESDRYYLVLTPPKYKSARGYKNWYTKQLARIAQINADLEPKPFEGEIPF